MNTYSLTFKAKCPADGSMIDYALVVHSQTMIMCEELRRICDSIGEGFHEHIADQLFDRFSGQQVLTATHGGDVSITTIRPRVEHWRRPDPNEQVMPA